MNWGTVKVCESSDLSNFLERDMAVVGLDLESEEGTDDENPVPEPASEVLTDYKQPAPALPDGLPSEQAEEVGENSKQQTQE